MEAKYFIQEGDVAKYLLVIEHADFSMTSDDFFVTLRWGLFGQSLTIQKSQMAFDEDDNCFMVFDSTDMKGRLTAECHYMVPDSDISGGVREEIDRQYIAFVTDNPCPRLGCCDSCTLSDDHVTYTRVWRSDVNTLYLNLRTTEANGEHRPLLDSDGNQLRVRKEESDLN